MTEARPPVCDYEGSDYQTSFWEQGDRAYEDLAEAAALARLLPAGGKMLLEVGAGAGRNSARYRGFEHVVLVDYSRTQLQQARDRLGEDGGRYLFVAADVYRLPFCPGVFDAATMIRVLHHMADAPLALKLIRETLQPGAVFILEFANKQNLKAIARYLLRRQVWSPFDREPVEFAALNFDFHPKAVDGWLRSAGFRVERRLTVSHFRMGLFKRLLPARFLAKLDAAAGRLTGDLWQLSPSVFVKARVTGETVPVEPVTDLTVDIFRCPVCGSFPLREEGEALVCGGCGRSWPVREGVYDFTGKGTMS